MRVCWMALTLTVLFSTNCFSQSTKEQSAKPKLVVGIVVDQMRWDYLYRYAERYTTGGFRRLLQQGFSNDNAMIPYTPTYTAAGHACIYTGSVPAINGIMGNTWYSKALGRDMYCAEDTTAQSVGTTTTAGRMSPANLWTTTITDELRLSTNFRSKVFSIAFKDRGAIFPGGHAANGAFWFDEATGDFISSTFYMKELPQWMVAFNARDLPDTYIKKNWNTLYPINTYLQSTADSTAFEKGIPQEDFTFPHITDKITTNRFNSFRHTPYANTLVVDAAKTAIEAEMLGQRGITDFLALSFSPTDYIGHEFGPNSVEVEDMYLRLDKDLAAFLEYLDGKLGKGNYTVFLTADHGVANNAAFLSSNRIPAGIYEDGKIRNDLNKLLQQRFGKTNMVSRMINYQVYFNDALVTEDIRQAVVDLTIAQLLKYPFIANAYESRKAAQLPLPATIQQLAANGYNMKLSGDIQYNYMPQWYASGNPKGTSHGVWYTYDTHIPLVWYGWGVKQGRSTREVFMTDIAATLAALLKIQMPSGCIGKPISELIR